MACSSTKNGVLYNSGIPELFSHGKGEFVMSPTTSSSCISDVNRWHKGLQEYPRVEPLKLSFLLPQLQLTCPVGQVTLIRALN